MPTAAVQPADTLTSAALCAGDRRLSICARRTDQKVF